MITIDLCACAFQHHYRLKIVLITPSGNPITLRALTFVDMTIVHRKKCNYSHNVRTKYCNFYLVWFQPTSRLTYVSIIYVFFLLISNAHRFSQKSANLIYSLTHRITGDFLSVLHLKNWFLVKIFFESRESQPVNGQTQIMNTFHKTTRLKKIYSSADLFYKRISMILLNERYLSTLTVT